MDGTSVADVDGGGESDGAGVLDRVGEDDVLATGSVARGVPPSVMRANAVTDAATASRAPPAAYGLRDLAVVDRARIKSSA
jgi:hypothetical protein